MRIFLWVVFLSLLLALSSCSSSSSSVKAYEGYYYSDILENGESDSLVVKLTAAGHNMLSMTTACSEFDLGSLKVSGNTLELSHPGSEKHPSWSAEVQTPNRFEFAAEEGHKIAYHRISEPKCETDSQGHGFLSAQKVKFIRDSLLGTALRAQQTSPNGMQHLEASQNSERNIGNSSINPDNANATQGCFDADGNEQACPTSFSKPYTQCTFTPTTETQYNKLNNALVLVDDSNLYPGALIQGKSFLNDGNYTPISIERAGANFSVSGLTFSDGKASFSVPEVSASQVADGMATKLLTANGTAAAFTYNETQIFSKEHLAAELKVNVDTVSVSAMGQFSFEKDSSKTYYLVTLKQVYYTVNMDAPSAPYAVFKDGEQFDDPFNTIGEGNEPLYIASVSYGRQIYFLMESSESATNISAAFKAAYDGGLASGEISGGLTYEDVMNKTTIHYFVKGGAAADALNVIAPKSGSTFNALKDYIGGEGSAGFSADSPGAPIAATLKYLVDSSVAEDTETLNYDDKQCVTKDGNLAIFKLGLDSIDDYVDVYTSTDDQNYQPILSAEIGQSISGKVIDTGGQKTYVKLVLHNYGGPTGVFWSFKAKDDSWITWGNYYHNDTSAVKNKDVFIQTLILDPTEGTVKTGYTMKY
ncbi:MAG: thiol-activated cytolysin family protein [Trueperaceae bacterium]|nr:thiol-activated cytolysin family protein [Trueperaceae bacterium]